MDNTIPNQLEALTADHLANVEQQIAECDRLRERLQHLHSIYRQILELLRAEYTPTPVGAAMALPITVTDPATLAAIKKSSEPVNLHSIAMKKAEKAKHPVVDGETVTCTVCGRQLRRMGIFNHMAQHKKETGTPSGPPAPKPPAPITDNKALLVRCDDCDIAYLPHQLRQLAEHVRIAHRRAMSKTERTPSVA